MYIYIKQNRNLCNSRAESTKEDKWMRVIYYDAHSEIYHVFSTQTRYGDQVLYFTASI